MTDRSGTIDLTVTQPDDTRTKTIKELYTSELIYIGNLHDMIEGFITPLKQNQILSPNAVSAIFSNIETIHKFHVEFFLKELTSRLSCWHDGAKVGDLFTQLGPCFRLYKQYCSNYEQSINQVQKHKKVNPTFEQFLKDAQYNERFAGKYITSLLILPIQRIPRYEMFLKELVKRTPNTHTDYKDLSDSLAVITEVAVVINQECVIAENIQKITEISRNVGIENLLTPTRKFVREDDVEMVSGNICNGPCKCFIFNDLIIFAFAHKKTKNFFFKPLLDCWVKEHNELSLQLVTINQTYVVEFPSDQVKEGWEQAVNNTINEIIANHKGAKEYRDQYTLSNNQEGLYIARPTDPGLLTEPVCKKKTSLLDQWKKELREKTKRSKKRSKTEEKIIEHLTTSINLTETANRRSSLPHNENSNIISTLAPHSVSNPTHQNAPHAPSGRPSLQRSISVANNSNNLLGVNNLVLTPTPETIAPREPENKQGKPSALPRSYSSFRLSVGIPKQPPRDRTASTGPKRKNSYPRKPDNGVV